MIPYFQSLYPEEISGAALDHLLALGWYRMDQRIFTSSHVGLDTIYRVHWLRYSVNEIKTHRSHQKILNRTKDFYFKIGEFNSLPDTHENLYRQYRASIDFDGAGSIEECLFGDSGTESNVYNTRCISVFDQEKLIAAGYFDLGDRAVASILHFYDPLYKKFSLGKYLILLTIDYLKLNGYEFYYPGYVVEGNRKMDYKLFLGKDEAQYFDPETASWKYFEESILIRPAQN